MFGQWSIDKIVYDWIEKNLPQGSTILELGSGNSTQALKDKWKVFSVEENIDWVNKFHNNYIHAPIKDNYYDIEILEAKLPKKYDLLLVDGPAYGDRNQMLKHFSLFNMDTSGCRYVIFDDVERPNDLQTYRQVLDHVSQTQTVLDTGIITQVKSFAFIVFDADLQRFSG